MQKQSFLFSRDSKWPPCDEGLLSKSSSLFTFSPLGGNMLLSTLMQQQLLLSLTDRPHKLMSHWRAAKGELSAFFFLLIYLLHN